MLGRSCNLSPYIAIGVQKSQNLPRPSYKSYCTQTRDLSLAGSKVRYRVCPRESRGSATVSPVLHVIGVVTFPILHLFFSSWRPNANEMTRQRVMEMNSKPTLNFRMERQETMFSRMTNHSSNSSSSRALCGRVFLFACSSFG